LSDRSDKQKLAAQPVDRPPLDAKISVEAEEILQVSANAREPGLA
jgi:hypothetical protein